MSLHLRSVEEDLMRGFLLNGGLQYELTVGKNLLGIGFVFTPSFSRFVHIDRNAYHMTYRVSTAVETPVDTLYREGDRVRMLPVRNPAMAGCGLSWSRPESFWLGVDAEWNGWSRYAVGESTDSLRDMFRFSAGAGWIPQAGSSNYFKKITYSAGCFYEQDYVLLGETSFHRIGMDLGFVFPVKKNKSGIGLNLETGVYAPDKGEGIHEQYYRITLHLQLHERWYQHRKLE